MNDNNEKEMKRKILPLNRKQLISEMNNYQ